MSRDAEQQAWIEAWARHIKSLGLSPVALALLEIAHTFGFLGSQVLLVAQPLMTGIVNDTALERAADLLESPEMLERFRGCLERGES
ncbi:MAG: hypothetical protein GWN58_67585 [Anaerolineae bacterium]|nr:hypothetical protein [Anaerolineae bacterium]